MKERCAGALLLALCLFALAGCGGNGCSKGTLQSSVHVLSSSRNASLSWVSSLPHLR